MATIVRLITRLNIGGPARQALMLTRELRDEYTTVLGAGRPPPEEGELSDPQVAVVDLPLTRQISLRTDGRAFAATRHLLDESDATIVHTHMAKAGAIGRLAASSLRRRPRTVHTFHGHVLEGYFSPRKAKLFVNAERALARRTDALVAVSEQTRDELLELGIGRPEQYRVIHVGFDLRPHRAVAGRTGYLRDRAAVGDDVLLFGVIGRLAPIKDHHLLLDALARTADVHLAVLGDGELKSALLERARVLGIEKRVHFVGWCHNIPAALADLDAVVCSSRNEGTPVALIEAGAASLPVISTDVGGVRTVVTDGESGLLVPPGDPEGLSSAMARLAHDPGLRAELGQEGRRRSAQFDSERLVADIRALYRELGA